MNQANFWHGHAMMIAHKHWHCYGVAAWRSGNSVGHINEVTLCRARLVLGWVAIFGR